MMFMLEHAFCPHSLADCSQYEWLVVGMNILVQPISRWFPRIRDEAPAVELSHLAPVGTHAINHVRTGVHECPEPLFAPAQQLLCLLAFGNVGCNSKMYYGFIRISQGCGVSFHVPPFAI